MKLNTQHGLATLAQAGAVEMSGEALPADIQFMPPGRQTVAPRVNGAAKEMTIDVGPSYADVFDRALQAMIAKAKASQGDTPFFDFDHEDMAASAWPVRFFWGGEDPRTGGVRAAVEWSGAGKAAVTEKNYRRFSPQWIFHRDTGAPLGLPVNCGGLVNRAAFKTIADVAAARASAAVWEAGVEGILDLADGSDRSERSPGEGTGPTTVSLPENFGAAMAAAAASGLAAALEASAGDYVGHPFRGNQYGEGREAEFHNQASLRAHRMSMGSDGTAKGETAAAEAHTQAAKLQEMAGNKQAAAFHRNAAHFHATNAAGAKAA